MRIELEHNQWATFRDDVEEISNRDRRPIMAIYEDPNQPEGWPRAIKANHQLLKWLITGWSLTDAAGAPRPLPRENGEVLEEIRARGYATLIAPRGLPPHFRTYQLCRTFGWTVAEAEAAPAPLCDWLLAIDEQVEQGLAERQQRTQSQRKA